ncbi:CBS domain-containing protein [Kribbella shirazensis]|uniref:CBS domain-containing protein n=1 Tax=Kribbella shirazensis TaxID=1105143 RepID=A0A7X6A3D5_9ACTN|nr:CBS domain-containing protein [Kribbella shirazensis]NIK59224.1 CBS domain-containing protein [Kribbella shirazensis]
MLIRDLMSAPVMTVSPETPISSVLRLLDAARITSVPVVGRHGTLLGIVSEADIMEDEALIDDRVPVTVVRVPAPTPPRRVAEVMTHLVVTVQPDDDLEAAIDLMRSTMMKSLPVVEYDRVVGMISRSDVIHLLAGRDRRIQAEVTDLLQSEAPHWRVEVQDGIVTVTGPVDPRERHLAEVLCGTVRGVVGVQINRLSTL